MTESSHLFPIHHPSWFFEVPVHKSTMSRYNGFPPPCSGTATATKPAPLDKPIHFAVVSSHPPPPVHDAMHHSMHRAGIQAHRPENPVSEEATAQGPGFNDSSTKEPERTCEECGKNLSGFRDEANQFVGQGRPSSYRDPAQAKFRNQVMNDWYNGASKHEPCRYSNSFYKHGTQPCNMGWGKAFYEHMRIHGKHSMETEKVENILEEYRQRHMKEDRPKTPEMRPVPGKTDWWGLVLEHQRQQQPDQREENPPSASSRVYRRS
jgi:hypothetical protein